MNDISTLMIRVRYALEPNEDSARKEFSDELEQLLDSIRRSLESKAEEDRIRLIEEIETFSIQIDEARGECPELAVVNG